MRKSLSRFGGLVALSAAGSLVIVFATSAAAKPRKKSNTPFCVNWGTISD